MIFKPRTRGATIDMEFQQIWVLRGANIWARCPVLEVELDLTGFAAVTEDRLAACTARLRAAMPSLAHRPIGPDRPGLLRDLTLELQRLAGSPVQIGLVRPGGREGFFRVIAVRQSRPRHRYQPQHA
jgi:hypothetical protein